MKRSDTAYYIEKFLICSTVRTLFRLRVTGQENVPAQGPVVLVSNHFHAWDPPVMGCSVQRVVHFMAKEELINTPVLGRILRAGHVFPVKRGAADRAAMRHALEVLADGNVVGLFPEGTRQKTGQLGKAQPGTAWIAVKAKAPVVPMAIISDYKWGGPVSVRIGKPIDLAQSLPEKPSADDLAAAGDRIMAEIARLMEQGHLN